jgi:hypothetical protein
MRAEGTGRAGKTEEPTQEKKEPGTEAKHVTEEKHPRTIRLRMHPLQAAGEARPGAAAP